MSRTILIGNAIAFAGAILMVLIGFLKTKKNILRMQCVQFAVMGIGNLVLGGATGFLSNMVSIVRNLVSFRRDLTVPLKLVFIVILAVLGLSFNTLGIVGWLPVFSAALFTWFLDTKSEVTLKLVIIASQVMWCIFDFTIHNYMSLAMDVFTICSNVAGIFLVKRDRGQA